MRGRRGGGSSFVAESHKGTEAPPKGARVSNSYTLSNRTLLYRDQQGDIRTLSKAMKILALFFVLLLACMYPSLAQGTYENCCLSYVKEVKKSIKRRTVSYRIQEMDGGCNIPAIVFRLKKSRTFCGDPKQQWVKDLLKNITRETALY